MKAKKSIIILVCVLASCNSKNKSDKISDNFISRIHTISMETDWYELIGPTSLEKHLDDFDKINWAGDYWKEYKNQTFNAPDLEVLNIKESKYFSVSACPNTFESYQFYFGYGTHKTDAKKNKISRTVKLYGTATDNKEDIKKYIRLFFNGDLKELETQLEKLDFLEELEDVYQNIDK